MEARVQNGEKLYWDTAKRAIKECKLAEGNLLALCRSNVRFEGIKALQARYGHLFSEEGEPWGRIGSKLIERMVALHFPAYHNDLEAIDEMCDDPYHTELNAHYYLQTGRVLTEDYALPAFDWAQNRILRERDEGAALRAWEEFQKERLALFLSIAEGLWDYPMFVKKYSAVLSAKEMESYYAYCKKVFVEDRVFLQLEWLLFSCPQWQGREAFLFENARTAFFLRAHKGKYELLPACVFESRILRTLLVKKYKVKDAGKYFAKRK